jgi:hypothetical protein
MSVNWLGMNVEIDIVHAILTRLYRRVMNERRGARHNGYPPNDG